MYDLGPEPLQTVPAEGSGGKLPVSILFWVRPLSVPCRMTKSRSTYLTAIHCGNLPLGLVVPHHALHTLFLRNADWMNPPSDK